MADTNTSSTPETTLDTDAATGAAETKRTATQQLKDEAAKFGNQAADRARDYAGQGKDKATNARDYAGQGKDKATNALDEVAKMFTSAAGDVDSKFGEEYGRYARSAADGITGFADALRGKEVDDLIAEATDFVRKSPVIAVGTAAAVGFVLARLIKSGIDAATPPQSPDA